MPTIINQTFPDQKENELLQCLQSNDQRQFSKLYDSFSSALFGLISKWIGDAEIAENLLQDVFVKVWRNSTQYDASKGRLFTWMYNIARNVCIDHLRSKAHKQNKASVLSDDVPVLLPPGNNNNFLPDTIDLRKLVNRLKQEEKEVIEMMYFKGYTQSEIAEVMNMPLGTVKTRMSRAIRNLRYFFKKDWKRAIQNISLN